MGPNPCRVYLITSPNLIYVLKTESILQTSLAIGCLNVLSSIVSPLAFLTYFFIFVVCCDTFGSHDSAKRAQQIKCHVKQKRARNPPLAAWLTRLNKQLALQIIHVNGTENENQDLQCI